MHKTSQSRAKALRIIAAAAAISAPFAAIGAPTSRAPRWYDQYRDRPSVAVSGTIWDFYKRNKREMAPDFDSKEPKFGKGQYCDIMRSKLDAEGKPVFSGGGYRVEQIWVNEDNVPIIPPRAYIDSWVGDRAGYAPKKAAKEQGDAVTPEEDVASWWRDVPGMNETFDADITFTRMSYEAAKVKKPKPPKMDKAGNPKPPKHPDLWGMPDEGDFIYVFDAQIPKMKRKKNSPPAPKPGADDILDLIAQGKAKKKRYSFEAQTTFIYEKGAYWWLTAGAMDDVWVFIDDRLVIDIGGAYKHKEKKDYGAQTIELDRLGWLKDGGTYSLKIFMVDRDKKSEKSHLKVMTNIPTLGLFGQGARAPEYD